MVLFDENNRPEHGSKQLDVALVIDTVDGGREILCLLGSGFGQELNHISNICLKEENDKEITLEAFDWRAVTVEDNSDMD